MSKKNLDLIKKSIGHWEDNAKGPPFDNSSGSCALCRAYFIYVDTMNVCNGCPVKECTGRTHCHGTPYHDACDAFEAYHDDEGNDDLAEEAREASKEEVEFLRKIYAIEEKKND